MPLVELRSKGLIKAFFEVTAAGRRVFTVEYPDPLVSALHACTRREDVRALKEAYGETRLRQVKNAWFSWIN